jgi:hypothetical protein
MSLRDAARQAWLSDQQATEIEARATLVEVLNDQLLVDGLTTLHVDIGDYHVRWFFQDAEGLVLRVSRASSNLPWVVELVEQVNEKWMNLGKVSSLKRLWELLPVQATVEAWVAGGTYVQGDVRSYEGINYRCIQGHTNYDPGHTPPLTPALWEVIS